MKIDRVILSSNNNETYYGFWNSLSKVYLEKFKIRPTLVWVGNEQEIKDCEISDKYGDILIIEPNPNYPVSAQCTIANFYATRLFPDEVCFICGIDQVPLSQIFIKDLISDFNNQDYVMLISDAYLPNHWSNENGTSPSSYHISKGSSFNEIYNFDDSFFLEVNKIFELGTLEKYLNKSKNRVISEDYWGIDESYFSYMLRGYHGDVKIISKDYFKLLKERRIECFRSSETPYDLEKLKNGWYSESHLCRPYKNHINYIEKLFNEINYYE